MDKDILQLLASRVYPPEFLDWMRRWQQERDLECILEGHIWRDNVPGFDGMICVRCARKPNE